MVINYLLHINPKILVVNDPHIFFLDRVITVSVAVFLLHLFMIRIWRQYNYEKGRAESEITIVEKQNQMISKQINELNLASQTKDKLNAIIAHDIKGPFAAFKDLVNYLYTAYDEFTDEERLEAIAAINSSSESLNLLIKNLLSWSGLKSGRTDFKPEEFDAVEYIDQNLKLLKVLSDKKDNNIKKNINYTGKIYADIEIFSTIVRNLISNAIKFTPIGGEITIDDSYNKGTRILLLMPKKKPTK